MHSYRGCSPLKSSSERSRVVGIVPICQMRREDKITALADVVAIMAKDLGLRRVDAGDGRAVVYVQDLVNSLVLRIPSENKNSLGSPNMITPATLLVILAGS